MNEEKDGRPLVPKSRTSDIAAKRSEHQDDHADPPFSDRELPHSYVPFNVHAVGNNIVVTYALLEPGAQLETDGPGLDFVDIYDSTGVLVQRLEHGDWLNAPWGIALAPLDFGRFSHDLLIGQFAGAGDTPSRASLRRTIWPPENSTGCCRMQPGSRCPSKVFGR